MYNRTITRIFLWVSMAFLLPTACTFDVAKSGSVRDQDFNAGWRFSSGNTDGAENPAYDDSGWRKVDLPHDWSVEDLPVQDSNHIGPFYKLMKDGHDVGYLEGGTAWYRKSFSIDPENRHKQVILNFDGVQSEATLFVNGKEAGRHVYGYTPFYFNITPYLKDDGSPEVIAVKVFKPEENSRWFTGAGIYRPVTVSFLDPVHISTWGVGITTLPEDRNTDGVELSVEIFNQDSTDAKITVRAQIITPQNVALDGVEKTVSVPTGQSSAVLLTSHVIDPQRWDTEHPLLYTAKITLLRGERTTDEYNTSFGIRSIRYSAKTGFLLNDSMVLMKGACMHHDNGLLGAAAFARAEERRVEIMKKNGYNAIRTSHNPPSKAFLDACDKLGILVIDEAFDAWMKAKRPNDYHVHFADWWKKDLAAMVLRDRNHPSVIMWSIGNEIPERSDPSGLEIARKLIDEVRSIDTTRPVTEAVCEFWDNQGKDWDYSSHAFSVLDIGGYNYQWKNYEKDHEKFPGRIMVGTESVAKEAYENWRLVEEQPYVIGDFVWTGWDYLGEASIGHATWRSPSDGPDQFALPWPWYVSNCGDIDILGNKKPQSYFRDVVWGESNLEMAVHVPAPEGKEEVVFFWGWPQEYQSWNWAEEVGRTLDVTVYSSYPKVRMELNGESLGEKEIAPGSGYKAVFAVPYQPGELKVSGIVNGEVSESKVLKTTGPVVGIRLSPERKKIGADPGEIAYIDVVAVDADGNVVPDSNVKVQVSIGGEAVLIAAGNASPYAEGSMQDGNFNLFRGKGMVIVRSTGKKGKIRISAGSEGIASTEAEIVAGDPQP